jgi:copper resistance protein B
MTKRIVLCATLLIAPSLASAQDMDHAMPGMVMPAAPAKPNKAAKPPVKTKARRHSGAADTAPAHEAHGSAPAAMSMPGMAMPMAGNQGAASGTDLPAGNAAPPPAPTDHYGDRTFGSAAMAGPRAAFQDESGGQAFSQIMVNLAELQVGSSHPGYRWDGEGWFGGDINRFVVKSEGSGASSNGVEDAEVQALYSRAIGPYFNLQAGVRQDIQPTPARTYATVGFEGLAPYWFEVGGALFLSTKGDLLGRLEGYYDQNITQRLILQPRVELNFAAQDVPENQIGAGLSNAELGLRLRYEISREFAPYIGVSWDRKVGRTADFSRMQGEDASSLNFVVGVRSWF